MRPATYPRYRPSLTDEERRVIEAAIPDGYHVTVMPTTRRNTWRLFAFRDDTNPPLAWGPASTDGLLVAVEDLCARVRREEAA
jgi:hypothetical protein